MSAVDLTVESEIIEGFLCPMCMKDFGTITQLHCHFEDAHNADDRAGFRQFKGFFDKAKKKILRDRDVDSNPFSQQFSADDCEQMVTLTGYDSSWRKPQELGCVRSHIDFFKSIRCTRVDYFVVEVNKLLIRLDKLLTVDSPMEDKKRKAFEMSVVQWMPDKQVPLCLMCGRAFSVLVRRHHCRLCGVIMCDKCSQFFSHQFARKLIDPAFTFEGDGFLRRTDSGTSLNSLVVVEEAWHTRVCTMCRSLLERRHLSAEQRSSTPSFVQLYEKMKTCIGEAEAILPVYLPMVDSLSQGESTYRYRDAIVNRAKLVKLYEAIDHLSKDIVQCSVRREPPPSQRQISLQKAIRLYASNFMQDNLAGLQNLPTEDEIRQLQGVRTARLQLKIAEERQAALRSRENERQRREREFGPPTAHAPSDVSPAKDHINPSTSKTHQRSQSGSSVGEGWNPVSNAGHASHITNPVLQQIEIIRAYIRQAKRADKMDEVAMLERNLADLQTVFMEQRKDANKL